MIDLIEEDDDKILSPEEFEVSESCVKAQSLSTFIERKVISEIGDFLNFSVEICGQQDNEKLK